MGIDVTRFARCARSPSWAWEIWGDVRITVVGDGPPRHGLDSDIQEAAVETDIVVVALADDTAVFDACLGVEGSSHRLRCLRCSPIVSTVAATTAPRLADAGPSMDPRPSSNGSPGMIAAGPGAPIGGSHVAIISVGPLETQTAHRAGGNPAIRRGDPGSSSPSQEHPSRRRGHQTLHFGAATGRQRVQYYRITNRSFEFVLCRKRPLRPERSETKGGLANLTPFAQDHREPTTGRKSDGD